MCVTVGPGRTDMRPQCFGDWWHLFKGEEQLATYPRALRDVMRSLAARAYAAGVRADRPAPAPEYAVNTTGLTPEQIDQVNKRWAQ